MIVAHSQCPLLIYQALHNEGRNIRLSYFLSHILRIHRYPLSLYLLLGIPSRPESLKFRFGAADLAG